eukprot:3844270-Rhodomonas_salina.2
MKDRQRSTGRARVGRGSHLSHPRKEEHDRGAGHVGLARADARAAVSGPVDSAASACRRRTARALAEWSHLLQHAREEEVERVARGQVEGLSA